MLDFIKINNFGCFNKEYSVYFNKLNVIVGPNNSGKSTIFKALNLSKISIIEPKKLINWKSDYYSLVGFNEMAYNISSNFYITVKNDKCEFTLNVIGDTKKISIDKPISNEALINNLNNILYIGSYRKTIKYQNPTGRNNDQTDRADNYFTKQIQALYPDGRNIIQFLLEKSTMRDNDIQLFECWLRKIDSQIKLFKTPVVAYNTSLSTRRSDGNATKAINLHFQGNGIQNAVIIIAAVIFSPKNSTVIIEEPELYQHSTSIEILVDLFNYAVNKLGKQIIIVTHSMDIINAYCSDIGEGTPRGNQHEKANPDDFKLIIINKLLGLEKIIDYSLVNKKYSDVRNYMKNLLG